MKDVLLKLFSSSVFLVAAILTIGLAYLLALEGRDTTFELLGRHGGLDVVCGVVLFCVGWRLLVTEFFWILKNIGPEKKRE